MTATLYYYPLSAPCRTVLVLGKMLGIEFDLKSVNPLEKEQLKREFVELNPQHTIPTLYDDGLVLWESRVILTYLCSAYGKDDTYYPSDVRTRAIVDQRLQFDLGTLYHRMAEYIFPVIMIGAPLDEKKYQKLQEALGWLNSLLEKKKWIACNHFTIADLSICVTIGQMEAFDIPVNKHGNIMAWMERCKIFLEPYGYHDIIEQSAEALAGYFRTKSKA